MLIIFDEFSPFRGPVWRWEFAEAIINRQSCVGPADDRQVQTAVAYRRRLDEHATPRSRGGGRVGAAHRLYTAADSQRWEIEARLLAGESDERIAEVTGTSPEVVATYESLFFAVRERLDATMWILLNALSGPHAMAPCVAEDGLILRWLGWTGGSQVVDILTADMHGRDEPQVDGRHELARTLWLLGKLQVTPESDTETTLAILREAQQLRPGLAEAASLYEQLIAVAKRANGPQAGGRRRKRVALGPEDTGGTSRSSGQKSQPRQPEEDSPTRKAPTEPSSAESAESSSPN